MRKGVPPVFPPCSFFFFLVTSTEYTDGHEGNGRKQVKKSLSSDDVHVWVDAQGTRDAPNPHPCDVDDGAQFKGNKQKRKIRQRKGATQQLRKTEKK
jgi:hypothetical protein